MKIFDFVCFVLCSVVIFSDVVFSKGKLVSLDESTWSEMLEGEWMVEFFAPWCPACQHLTPVWNDFSQWSDDLSIKVANVDVTQNPGLSGRFMITALPTIYHIKDGVFRQYRGARDKESFISFVEEKKWQSVEEVPWYRAPSSFTMTVVSTFFKLSMHLRNIQSTLTEDYGLPYWGAYIVFGIATVVVGALLGLLIVVIIDLFYKGSVSYKELPADPKDKDKNEDESEHFEDQDIIQDDSPKDSDVRRRMGAGDEAHNSTSKKI